MLRVGCFRPSFSKLLWQLLLVSDGRNNTVPRTNLLQDFGIEQEDLQCQRRLET